MSDHSHAAAHEEDHTGPVKTPKQLLMAVFFSFVIPIFVIIGLVYYVNSANKPAAGTVNMEKSVAERIQKIGSVEIRDANREMKAGDEVYKIGRYGDLGPASQNRFRCTLEFCPQRQERHGCARRR